MEPYWAPQAVLLSHMRCWLRVEGARLLALDAWVTIKGFMRSMSMLWVQKGYRRWQVLHIELEVV